MTYTMRWALCCVLLVACDGGGGGMSERVVDSRGGTVTTADGSGVAIPAGALATSTAIIVAPAPDVPAPVGVAFVGMPYIFGPGGLNFAVPVTVTLAFDSARLPAGRTAADIRVWTAPSSAGPFVQLPTTRVDATHVAAQTSHFSIFAAGVFSTELGDAQVADLGMAPPDGAMPPPDGGMMMMPPPDGGMMMMPPPDGGMMMMPPPDGGMMVMPPPDGGMMMMPRPDGGMMMMPPPDGGMMMMPPPDGGMMMMPPPDGGMGAGPFISSFMPTRGYIGTTLTIRGMNLNSAIGVRIGPETTTNFTVDSPTQITLRIPIRTPTGPQNVVVLGPMGMSQAMSQYTVDESFGTWREDVTTSYAAAPTGLSGTFRTGQNADLLLSGIDFNRSGGSLLFNHPSVVATDGTHLVLADRNNNRVLIWNAVPTANTPPDIVLGQPDMNSNDPGGGLDQMNWPVSVSIGGGRLAVSDANNDRILLWDTFPTTTQQAASRKIDIEWPWGVWTNGTRVAATQTGAGRMRLWNTWPTMTNQAADVTITGQGMGTPRTITSNGTYMVVGDHNATVGATGQMNHFWTSWPTANDTPPSFYRQPVHDSNYGWMNGTITTDNRLILFGRNLYLWNTLPTAAMTPPDLTVGRNGTGNPSTYYDFTGGDGSGVAVAGTRLFISGTNWNSLIAYNAIPTRGGQAPDYAVGAPDTQTNTLNSHYFITNPNPRSDGTSLFVSSDFDRAVYVWRRLPNTAGAYPDYVFHTTFQPWDISLSGNKLFVAGEGSVLGWNNAPSGGEFPDIQFHDAIGTANIRNATGVSWDGTYFAVSTGDHIYIWNGVPAPTTNPAATINTMGATRLSSNGRYLATAVTQQARIELYDLMAPSAMPLLVQGSPGVVRFNLPGGMFLSGMRLFVADTSFHRVQVWNDLRTAVAGSDPDYVLGKPNLTDRQARATRSSLFMPATLSFDGSYLWVGEFKFSGRLVRFPIAP